MKNKSDLEIINEFEKLYKELNKIRPLSKKWDKTHNKCLSLSNILIERYEDVYNNLHNEKRIGCIWRLINYIKNEKGMI